MKKYLILSSIILLSNLTYIFATQQVKETFVQKSKTESNLQSEKRLKDKVENNQSKKEKSKSESFSRGFDNII